MHFLLKYPLWREGKRRRRRGGVLSPALSPLRNYSKSTKESVGCKYEGKKNDEGGRRGGKTFQLAN